MSVLLYLSTTSETRMPVASQPDPLNIAFDIQPRAPQCATACRF